MKTKYHHIRMEADGKQGRFICLHCNGSQTVNFPISIKMFLAIGKIFTKEHKDCKK